MRDVVSVTLSRSWGWLPLWKGAWQAACTHQRQHCVLELLFRYRPVCRDTWQRCLSGKAAATGMPWCFHSARRAMGPGACVYGIISTFMLSTWCTCFCTSHHHDNHFAKPNREDQ